MKKQTLILSLIKDDLINARLVQGLNQLGLQADDYSLHLSETVFRLLGIASSPQNEPLYERYFTLIKRVKFIHIPEDKSGLDALAQEIYQELLQLKTAA